MRLTDALRLQPGATLSFTGAGGKTSALRRLAAEASRRHPVVLTTTTRLGREQADIAEKHMVVDGVGRIGAARDALWRASSLLITGPAIESEGKWGAPPNDVLRALLSMTIAAGASLIVEADGARGRALKAPADHEPLVPNFTNIVVPVVGAAGLGQPLDETWVHRPERFAALTNLQLGERVSPEAVIRLLCSPEGGLKGVPAGAEVRVLVNQADAGMNDAVEQLAQGALEDDRIRAVTLAALSADPPVHAVRGRVAGVILAAGGSSRYGRPKLLELWRGEPIIRHVLRAAQASGLAPLVVVLGDHGDEVAEALGNLPGTRLVNRDWAQGQSTSLQAGLRAVEPLSEAAVFLLGDMPLIKPALIRRLAERHAATLAPIVLPWADGRRGNPVLFDRATFARLHEISGDTGGRAVFDQFEAERVEWEAETFFDLDTQDDFAMLEGHD